MVTGMLNLDIVEGWKKCLHGNRFRNRIERMVMIMNHDYAHCADFRPDCPRSCFRGNLTRELEAVPPWIIQTVTWQHFKGTKECMKTERGQ